MKKLLTYILLFACSTLTTCTPEFTMDDVWYSVEVQSNDESKGSVSAGGKYHYKDEITLEAISIVNHEFIEWSDGVKDNPRKLVITSDTVITAIFRSIPKYTITVRSNDTNIGIVAGGGTYYRDEKVTLYASPRYNCEFVRWNDGDTDISRTITVSQNQTFTAYFEKDASLPTENGHDYVDLGLPSGILWATCNIGANYPEGYGNYYAWGETKTKSNYNWDSHGEYQWGVYDDDDSLNGGMNKYNAQDGKVTLEASDDAAIVNWSGRWRMPTKNEIKELYSQCTWVWIVFNGVNGYKVVGPSGKSIFLPLAGQHWKTHYKDTGERGCYWSSSLSEYYNDDERSRSAIALDLREGFESEQTFWDVKYISNFGRFNGLSIRPVCSPQ